MMRIGRTLKSLLLLCFMVLPVLYVLYAKVNYTGSKRRINASSTNNEHKGRDAPTRTIHGVYSSTLKDFKLTQQKNNSNNTSFPPEQHGGFTQFTDYHTSIPNTTSSNDVIKLITGSRRGSDVNRGAAILPSDRSRTLLDDQKSRIQNLRLSCARHETNECKDVRKCNLTEFYYSRQYNFAYCKVPKSGSTFWMKLFLVLYDSVRSSRLLNTWSRSDIHTKTKRLITSPVKIFQNKSPTIIVSRNPYTRLFSAYTDKVFMPLFWGLFQTMAGVKSMPPYWINKTVDALKKSNHPLPPRLMAYRAEMERRGMLKKMTLTNKVIPICANNASFQDFLEFIIAEVKAKRKLEPHWAPISELCRPCTFNTKHIIKQEHFSEDVSTTLNSLNINSTLFEFIQNELLGNRVESSIPGVVRVVERKSVTPDVKMCVSNPEIVKRLWKSFQIQGYISDEEDVPADLLTNRFNKVQIISKAMESLKRVPMTGEQRSNQRQAYLIKAYRSISADVIAKIQEIFRSDFELFDYPLAPPV